MEERARKRNNCVIFGLEWDKPIRKERLEEWFKENLEVEVNIERVWSIGKEKQDVGIQVQTRQMKEEIMKSKSKLKDSKVFIENDYTFKEREIRGRILALAKKYKERGNRVKIGYMKLWTENSIVLWDEFKEKWVRQDIKKNEEGMEGIEEQESDGEESTDSDEKDSGSNR